MKTVALLAGFAVLAACGSTGSSPATSDAKPRTAAQELNNLLDRVQASKEYKIGYTLPQFRDPFWVSVAYGIEDEAKKSGVKVVVKNEAGSYADLTKQVSQVDDMTQRGLDAILVAPVDRVGIGPALDNAGKSGVTVVGAGNLGNSDAMKVGVTFSHIEVGEKIAEAMGEALKGKGSVAMLNGPNGADWAVLRNKGFKQKLKEAFPDIKIIEEAWINPDRAEGQRTMEDWIQRDGKKIDGVFSAVSLSAEGAVLALRAAGLNKKTFVATSSLSTATLDMVKSGDIQFCYAEPGQLVGRLAVQYAIRLLDKAELPLVQPAEGGETLPKKVVYVSLPAITEKNVGTYNPLELDWAPKGFQP